MCIFFLEVNSINLTICLFFFIRFQKDTRPQTRSAQVNEPTIRTIIVVIYAVLQRTERE